MHPNTILKYWEILEDSGWIKYEGKRFGLVWKNEFKERKKDKFGSYTLKKGDNYRLIPIETIKMLQEKLQISESELKLYILLANIQESALYRHKNYWDATLKDLCDLRGMTAHSDNKKKIYLDLAWLKAVGLVKYTVKKDVNNFGEKYSCIHLEDVYYYTNGGEIEELINSDYECMTEQMKAEFLAAEPMVKFEELE